MISKMRSIQKAQVLSDFHSLDMNVKTGITEKVDNLILQNTRYHCPDLDNQEGVRNQLLTEITTTLGRLYTRTGLNNG